MFARDAKLEVHAVIVHLSNVVSTLKVTFSKTCVAQTKALFTVLAKTWKTYVCLAVLLKIVDPITELVRSLPNLSKCFPPLACISIPGWRKDWRGELEGGIDKLFSGDDVVELVREAWRIVSWRAARTLCQPQGLEPASRGDHRWLQRSLLFANVKQVVFEGHIDSGEGQ